MRHLISALVENKFGVLARIAGLFSARGYNIHSLAVAETQDSEVSRVTMVVEAEDEKILEQIKKQLNKLVNVISVSDLTKKDYIERELLLVKVAAGAKIKPKLKKIAEEYEAKIDLSKADSIIFEATLGQDKEKKFLDELREFGIIELVRTGKIAIIK